MTDPFRLWSYLASGPLLWLWITLLAYWVGDALFRASGRRPWANPVLIAVVLIATGLQISGTAYETYFDGAQFVHFLLGPATVCLALPLQANLARVRRAALPVLAALLAGSLTAILTALGIAKVMGRGAGYSGSPCAQIRHRTRRHRHRRRHGR